MKKYVIFAAVISIVLSGCKTAGVNRIAQDDTAMYAMVYDYDNNVVSNVHIYVNDTYAGESDVQGRFVLKLPEKSDYMITLKKAGYETVERQIHFDPFLVLYFKMGNGEQFLYLAEESLDSGDTESAMGFVDRTLALESSRPDALFLKAIILYRQKQYEESNEVLSRIDRKDTRVEYIRRLEEKNIKGIREQKSE